METKMKQLVNILVITAFIFGSNYPLIAQNYEQIYQKGLIKEEGEGALQDAIALYNQIADNSNAEKSFMLHPLALACPPPPKDFAISETSQLSLADRIEQ